MNLRTFSRVAGLLLVVVLCPGCFGLMVVHPKQESSPAVTLGPRGVIFQKAAETNLTEAQVLAAWGAPDAKRAEAPAVTVWSYRGDYHCGYVIPMYLIPLPVPYPAGHKHTDLYFKDGTVFKATWTIDGRTGACLGPDPQFCLMSWNKDCEK